MTISQDTGPDCHRSTSRDRTRQRLRLIAISTLINGLIVLVLFLIVFRRPAQAPPTVIVAMQETKRLEDIDNQTVPRLQRFIDTSRPSASGMVLPLTSILSPVRIRTPDFFGLDPGLVPGLLSGFGNGEGDGDLGIGGDGFITTIDGMEIRAIKLGVVLDVSGSMKQEIAFVRREILMRFPNADRIEVNGCSATWSGAVEFDPAASRNRLTYQFKAPSTLLAIEMLIAHREIDALYWYSDLQDKQDDQGMRRLGHLLGINPESDRRPIRLYVHSVENVPSDMLMGIVERCGGGIQFPKKRFTSQ